jgi:hypothetical protein
MLRQGILPKLLPFSFYPWEKGREFRENSLNQYGKGHILGMLRLCARPAIGTRAPLSKTGEKELGQTETLLTPK